MVISASFSSKLLASIVGCLTVEYSSLITGLQKSSIVSYIGGLSFAVLVQLSDPFFLLP